MRDDLPCSSGALKVLTVQAPQTGICAVVLVYFVQSVCSRSARLQLAGVKLLKHNPDGYPDRHAGA